jgi:hypothetical protein
VRLVTSSSRAICAGRLGTSGRLGGSGRIGASPALPFAGALGPVARAGSPSRARTPPDETNQTPRQKMPRKLYPSRSISPIPSIM